MNKHTDTVNMSSNADNQPLPNSPFFDVPPSLPRPGISSPTPTVRLDGSEETLLGARKPVARPDAPRHANGASVTIHYGRSVGEMDCKQLCFYLHGLVPDETLANLKKDQVNGADWAWTIGRFKDIKDMRAEVGEISTYVMARLVREAAEVAKETGDVNHLSHDENVTAPGPISPLRKHGREQADGELNPKGGQSSSSPKEAKSPGTSGHEDHDGREARTYKNEKCPKSPDFDKDRKMCTRDQWEDYSLNVFAWLGM